MLASVLTFFQTCVFSVFLVVQLSNLCVLYSNLGSSFFCGFSEIPVLRIMSFDENTPAAQLFKHGQYLILNSCLLKKDSRTRKFRFS